MKKTDQNPTHNFVLGNVILCRGSAVSSLEIGLPCLQVLSYMLEIVESSIAIIYVAVSIPVGV